MLKIEELKTLDNELYKYIYGILVPDFLIDHPFVILVYVSLKFPPTCGLPLEWSTCISRFE